MRCISSRSLPSHMHEDLQHWEPDRCGEEHGPFEEEQNTEYPETSGPSALQEPVIEDARRSAPSLIDRKRDQSDDTGDEWTKHLCRAPAEQTAPEV